MGDAETLLAIRQGLTALAALPEAIRMAHPTAATLKIVEPLARTATRLLGEAPGPETATATALLLTESINTLRLRYAHLAGEYKRIAKKNLPTLPDEASIVGVAGGLTRAVAAAIARAWPYVVRGAKALASWVAKNPVKAAAGTAAASAAPSLVPAGRDLGEAVRAAAGGLRSVAETGGGIGGLVLIVLGILFLTRSNR